jgi:hypothetical protein
MALPAGTASAAVAGGQQGPGFLSVEGELRSVTTISASNAWAVGDTTTANDAPFLAHWDGKKWVQVISQALPSSGELFSVARFPGGAWAAGLSGTIGTSSSRPVILRLTGATARRVTAPSIRGGELLGVTATSSKNAWAVGNVSDNAALMLHWNGTSWTRTTLPAGAGLSDLSKVAATSATNAWAIGTTTNDDPAILRWNGKAWSRVALPAAISQGITLRGLEATSATSAWAVGFTQSDTSSKTVTLHWDGKTWKRVSSPNPQGGGEGNGLLGVDATSARNAVAVGSGFTGLDTGIVTERWNGTSWKTVAPPAATTGSLEGISLGTSGSGWGVGETVSQDSRSISLTLILRWNGTAWH